MRVEMHILVFDINGRLFAFDLNYVREVVKIKEYTRVPNAPEHILGVFNLRGQIVPLIRLSNILNIPDTEYSEAVILVYDDELVGIAVSSVKGVLRISKTDIRQPPTKSSEFISGIVKWNERLISILDAGKILDKISGNEI